MAREVPKLFKNHRRMEDNQSREMIWAFAMTNIMGASVRNRGLQKTFDDMEVAGRLADAIVAEYDKRNDYEPEEPKA